MWQSVLTFLQGLFQQLIDTVSPGRNLLASAQHLTASLPSNWGVSSNIGDTRAALDGFLNYIGFLDFFINLPIVMGVSVIIAASESAMLPVRIWRFVRSFIT